MIKNLKAKLRAWLIDLVREAVKAELRAEILRESKIFPVNGGIAAYDPQSPTAAGLAALNKAVNRPIHIDPSFEQMQAEALKEQEKYYEPKD